jgi:hypothetical protein
MLSIILKRGVSMKKIKKIKKIRKIRKIRKTKRSIWIIKKIRRI